MTPFEDFQDQVHTSARGSSAEHDAVDWLQRNGYSIVERNVRFTFGEIDLIAFDGDTLCFVEIKARASRRFGGASFAVPKAKQRQLVRLAGLYLARSAHTGPCRFDVLAMDGGEGGWQFTLFSNAFEAL